MQINKKAFAAGVAGLAMFASTAAAFAAPAVATGSVNVRTGPSSQYQRVDTLQRGERVEVTGCRGGWCYVEKSGADGWVSANYLQQVKAQAQRSAKPAISFSFSFGNVPKYEAPRRNDHRNDRNDRNDRDGRGDRNDRDGGRNR